MQQVVARSVAFTPGFIRSLQDEGCGIVKETCVRWLRFVTHPAGMGLALAATIVLWMPFGMGYYGWPWERPAARLAMAAFALGVPLYAAIGCAAAAGPKPSPFRLGVAACTLLPGLCGALAMLHWLRVYTGPP